MSRLLLSTLVLIGLCWPFSSVAQRAPYELNDDYSWVVVASRYNLHDARKYAYSFSQTIAQANVVATSNGLYAIIAGALKSDKSKANLEMLISLKLIAPDAFLTKGKSFSQVVWPQPSRITVEDLMASAKLKAAVARMQKGLKRLGLYTSSVDGLIGSGTLRAIKKFEKAYGRIESSPNAWKNGKVLIQIDHYSSPEYQKKKKRLIAISKGFIDIAEAAEAHKRGFKLAKHYRRAKSQGFISASEYRAARKAGFNNQEDFKKSKELGFKTATEMRRANVWEFSNGTNFRTAQKLGFISLEEMKRAQAGGFADGKQYTSYLVSGFKTVRDFREATKRNLTSRKEAQDRLLEVKRELVQKVEIVIEDASLFAKSGAQIPDIVKFATVVSRVKALKKELESASNISAGFTFIEELTSQLKKLEGNLRGIPAFIEFKRRQDVNRGNSFWESMASERDLLRQSVAQAKTWISQNLLAPEVEKILELIELAEQEQRSTQLEKIVLNRKKLNQLLCEKDICKN